MKVAAIFWSALIVAAVAWATPFAAASSSNGYSETDALPADIFLRLSEMRCENCTLIVRDLIEVGVVSNTIGSVKEVLSGDVNYSFRFSLLTSCYHCYQAAHFWEMNMLNRAATNEEIQHWLQSGESTPLIEYFSTLNAAVR